MVQRLARKAPEGELPLMPVQRFSVALRPGNGHSLCRQAWQAEGSRLAHYFGHPVTEVNRRVELRRDVSDVIRMIVMIVRDPDAFHGSNPSGIAQSAQFGQKAPISGIHDERVSGLRQDHS